MIQKLPSNVGTVQGSPDQQLEKNKKAGDTESINTIATDKLSEENAPLTGSNPPTKKLDSTRLSTMNLSTSTNTAATDTAKKLPKKAPKPGPPTNLRALEMRRTAPSNTSQISQNQGDLNSQSLRQSLLEQTARNRSSTTEDVPNTVSLEDITSNLGISQQDYESVKEMATKNGIACLKLSKDPINHNEMTYNRVLVATKGKDGNLQVAVSDKVITDKGSYGTLFKCTTLEGKGPDLAIKEPKKGAIEREKFKAECDSSKEIAEGSDHISEWTFTSNDSDYYAVSVKAEKDLGGYLNEYMDAGKEVPPLESRKLGFQVAEGMAQLFKNDNIWQDAANTNVLLTKDPKSKNLKAVLTDFGEVQQLKNINHKTFFPLGDPKYQSFQMESKKEMEELSKIHTKREGISYAINKKKAGINTLTENINESKRRKNELTKIIDNKSIFKNKKEFNNAKESIKNLLRLSASENISFQDFKNLKKNGSLDNLLNDLDNAIIGDEKEIEKLKNNINELRSSEPLCEIQEEKIQKLAEQKNMYSCGVVLYEIFSGGQTPYPIGFKEGDYQRNFADPNAPFNREALEERGLAKGMIDLIEGMVKHNPEERITNKQFLALFNQI